MPRRMVLDSEEQANLVITYFKMGRKKREDDMLREFRMKKIMNDILPPRPNQDPGGVQDDVIDEIIDNSGANRK